MIAELLVLAEQIKDETETRANTAERVGEMLEGIIGAMLKAKIAILKLTITPGEVNPYSVTTLLNQINTTVVASTDGGSNTALIYMEPISNYVAFCQPEINANTFGVTHEVLLAENTLSVKAYQQDGNTKVAISQLTNIYIFVIQITN